MGFQKLLKKKIICIFKSHVLSVNFCLNHLSTPLSTYAPVLPGGAFHPKVFISCYFFVFALNLHKYAYSFLTILQLSFFHPTLKFSK